MVLETRKSRPALSGIFFALFLLFVSFENVSPAESKRKSVLLICSAHPEMPFFTGYFAGLREVCDRFHPGLVEIFQEFLDTVRIDDAEYINTLPGYYKAKYASRKLDAIVTVVPEGIPFMTQTAHSIFPGVPVISFDNTLYGSTTNFDVDGCVDLILHLQPAVKKLFIICGSHPLDKTFAQFVRSGEKNFPKLQFIYSEDLSFEELIKKVSALPPDSAIFFNSFFRDSKGINFVPVAVASEVSKAANCPMYGLGTVLMGNGIVGGPMFDSQEYGLATGKELLRVLYGETAVKEPRSTKMKLFKQVDEREMIRWGLSEENLPPGYEIVNRVPSLWRDHKHKVMAVFLFIFLESALIFSLLIQRRRKKMAEEELLGTLDVLEGKQKELSGALAVKNEILESLIESKTTLQTIISSMPAGVLILEADSGKIIEANRTSGELFGMQPEELRGQPCPGCCEACIIRDFDPGFPEAGSDSFECSIHDEGGKEIFLFKTVAGIMLNGRLHIIECFLDITERKNAERKTRETEAQLVHADKMISLGTMAAGICHEINNPNNFILMNASLQELTWKEIVEKVDKYVEEHGDFLVGDVPYSIVRNGIPVSLRCVVEGSERIRTIVRDMKAFVSQSPPGIKEKIDINAVVRTSVNLLSNKLKKSTQNLIIEYGDDIPPAEGNAQRLGQVVINLLLNAAEALPDREKALNIKTFYNREQGKIILQVGDEGVGIDPGNLKRIFDPFFTTKRENGGTGLGLSISLSIIKAHGGQILITSKPGEGTTAGIEIPAADRFD
jgi:PAS domain S-box-containing protein